MLFMNTLSEEEFHGGEYDDSFGNYIIREFITLKFYIL